MRAWRRRVGALALLLASAALVGGCGGSGSDQPGTDVTRELLREGEERERARENEKKPAVLNTQGVAGKGMTLIDSKFFTLYVFSRDRGSKSTCYGACTKVWPPLMTYGAPAVGFGAYQAELGTTKRRDGTTQVTYAGRPVYRYAGDKHPDEIRGDGIAEFGGTWRMYLDPRY